MVRRVLRQSSFGRAGGWVGGWVGIYKMGVFPTLKCGLAVYPVAVLCGIVEYTRHTGGNMVVQQISVDTCSHHWMIQPADGPVSLGVCQFCFEAKEFKNSIDKWSFERSPGERSTYDADFLEE